MEIVSFQPAYAKAFYDLNIEWLEHYFYVEDYDREVLSKPKQYILNRNGHIFFAVEEGIVYGTVALMPHDENSFELTKMAVLPEARGKYLGHELMKHCISFSRKEGKNLMLYSNTLLENAIHIYRKFGFVEVPVETNSPYKRCNIKMTLTL